MMRKFTIYNLQFTIVLFCTLYIVHSTFNAPPTSAQSCTGSSSRAEGLISTPQRSATSKFGTSSGACIIDPKAVFTPYKVPTYEDLKSLYYTQAKAPIRKDQVVGSPTQGEFTSKFTQNDVLLVNGDLGDVNYTGTTKPSVIFVAGNLTIGSNVTYGDANSGLVFIVKGNVNILQTVTQVDAVIISEGTICTAFDGTVCPGANVTTSQLIINGSLISLNESAPIRFRRALTDNSQAAERINHQVKYLVLLRNLMSDTFQRWSEITGDEPIPSAPAPTPTPTPTPPPALAYKRVFVTSTTYNGNLGGVAGADAKCQAAATSPTANLGGTWKAWIADDTSASSPSVRFTHSTQPYKLLDGTTLANDWNSFVVSNSSVYNININEFGNTISSQDFVWTNVSGLGNTQGAGSSHCSRWSNGISADFGNNGRLNTAIGGGWTSWGNSGCNASIRLYCFEQ